MSSSAAEDAHVERPLPDSPHKVGRVPKPKRLKKRLVKKPDGRYLIYYDKT